MLTLQKTALAAALAFCANGAFAQSDDLSYASSEDVPSVPEVSFVHSISDADLRYAFGDAADLQVVALNAQQMEETEGAWAPLVFHGARLAITGAARWVAPHAGIGAVGGAGYSAGYQWAANKSINARDLAVAAGAGAVGGVVGAPIRSPVVSASIGGFAGGVVEGHMNKGQ